MILKKPGLKSITSFAGTVVLTAALSMLPAAASQACDNDRHDKVLSKWMVGDFHNHTTYTDGSWPMNDLIDDHTIAPHAVEDTRTLYKKGTGPSGFRNGLDFFTNSEHGGIRDRDGFGNFWNNTSAYSTLPSIGDPTGGKMWRWQSLIRTSDIPGYAGPAYMGAYDWIETIRANYPEKIVMTGMEWNAPGHEHCSTAVMAADALPISEFEYRFDNSDTDGTTTNITAITMGWPGKIQTSSYVSPAYPDYSAVLALNSKHNKTMDAVKWMRANYPLTSYAIPAHVERAGCGVGGWSIAAFRDMNDNAPSVAFGFEGIPGHDKSPERGEFKATACGGGTYGGAGTYVATVGGLWDNLLADGRKFFNFDNSDFHDDDTNGGVDFWPGEYEKTYVKVKAAHPRRGFTQEDVINGLRSGNSFSVHGDLINALDFRVFHGASVGNHSDDNFAAMGEALDVRKGEKITVQIRFKSPESNNCNPGDNTATASYVCAAPKVHHIQLIQGRINPTRATKFLSDGVTPNPDYNAIDPTVASVVKTFDASSWYVDKEGYTTMTFTVKHTSADTFFRIRGSNLGYGVVKMDPTNTKIVYGTDAEGNPLINTPGTNNADMAWDDLWFYSNPIYVNVK
ncbi:MAG TPA: hypothetical protein VK448_05375 [Dissulfurispiraceae bacterium]|nr:hypothetical protein [Dissulfurispiraceae bacterium]